MEEFNKKIKRALSSKVYLDFCRELYGYKIYLFNMMDKKQLDYLFNEVVFSANDHILDIGCGTGSILDYLIDKYSARGTGIDSIDKNILTNNGIRVPFIEGDINKLEKYDLKPTVALAIDSLYFGCDIKKVIKSLLSMGCKRSYLYYSHYIGEKKGDSALLIPEKTPLGAALAELELDYNVIDYGENERELYHRGAKLLSSFKDAFYADGMKDLYKEKMEEYTLGSSLFAEGRAARFLYILEGAQ